MSGYKYREQPGFVNFDYAFWDEASNSFWHANHMDYGDPSDPMIVLQSTKESSRRATATSTAWSTASPVRTTTIRGLAAIVHAGNGSR